MYLEQATNQAGLPEKFFTHNNNIVKYSTGGYSNYNTTSDDVPDKVRGTIKLFARAGKRAPIEKFLNTYAPSS